MLRNSLILLVLLGFAAAVFPLVQSYEGKDTLTGVAEHYANYGKEEVGAANLVSAVVVTYRGFDTLGEVTILFLASAVIGLFLKVSETHTKDSRSVFFKSTEILVTASRLLVPMIMLLGAYIFINGHLTPGGGFQGGAVIASAFALLLLSRPQKHFSHKVISVVESISGIAFVFIGLLGILLAGGFLDNHIFAMGKFGTLLSAGAIPIIYILIGLKVGSELTGIVRNLKESQKVG